MLQVKELFKKYKNKNILNDVSIKFSKGKVTALVGPNGVGKTTLLKILMGLESQTSGEIFFNEENITKLSTHKRVKKGISYMSQFSSAITDLTVEDNLYLIPPQGNMVIESDDPTIIKKTRKRELLAIETEYREYLLKEFDLQSVRNSRCKNLSGGELKKLEFCLCMATRPKVILLDEPFAGLDPKSIKLIIKMILQLQSLQESSNKLTLIIVDHRIDQIKELASEYILLYEKEVKFSGNKEEFFFDKLVKEYFLG